MTHTALGRLTAGRRLRSSAGFSVGKTRLFLVASLLLVVGLSFGCNSGGREGKQLISGVNVSAAPLPFDNRSYGGPDLETKRYAHTATTLEDGRVLVVGGSDERLLTSLDSAEIFDQSIRDVAPLPESITGKWIDTNFVGDPILLKNGGRIYHTATLLPDGNVLVCGGSEDAIVAEAHPISEIFDAVAREFAPDVLEVVEDMLFPRFRHTATLLSSGRVLIVGGQRSVQETIIDPNFPPGSPFFQFDITVFPSTKSIEVFNPSSLSFELPVDGLGQEAELQSSRGRASHATAAIAGFDGRVGTGDDVILTGCGYQTLSTIFAPELKFPGQPGRDLQASLEFFDQDSQVNSLAAGVALLQRASGATMMNLGLFRDSTFDVPAPGPQIKGVNNIVMICNGDNDGGCLDSTTATEIIVCTFTGFGPATGIQFFQPSHPTGGQGFEGLVQDPMNCAVHGRSSAPAVALPARRLFEGTEILTTWILTAGGHWTFTTPGGCAEIPAVVCNFTNIAAFHIYDPFYDVNSVVPWELGANRSSLNPTGVIGVWLNADGFIPQYELTDVGGGMFEALGFDNDPVLTQPVGLLKKDRVMHTLSQLPGEDGILNTPDDRVLVAGGGATYLTDFGGEVVSISCEIYLPPGANGL
ncbi:MAG: hypothetical protein ACKVX7_18210 [Planctomycetota bacterium]